MDKRKEQKILNEYYKRAIRRSKKRDRRIKVVSIAIIIIAIIIGMLLISTKTPLFSTNTSNNTNTLPTL